MTERSNVSIAIIGAGPYGLSIAAHLRVITGDIQVFGKPMDTWLSHMPDGMFLKSEGFASNLSDPGEIYTLASYCAKHNAEYDDSILPISIERFREYGLSFWRDRVPAVSETAVVLVENEGSRFRLTLADGSRVRAEKVIVASGVMHYAHVPAEFQGVAGELASHSSQHVRFERFAGKEVVVIGAGQSALETAALLHERGATVSVLARRGSIEWNRLPKNRSLLERWTKPSTPLGRGRRAWIYANAPIAFHYLPEPRRREIVAHTLGPAGAWWLKDRVLGKVSLNTESRVIEAKEYGGRVKMRVEQGGITKEMVADHVIAGTGYVVDVRRLNFLAPSLVARLRHTRYAPQLSTSFESSVPGLYFAGLSAAMSFGPVMRFVAGTAPTARRLAQHFRRVGRAARLRA